MNIEVEKPGLEERMSDWADQQPVFSEESRRKVVFWYCYVTPKQVKELVRWAIETPLTPRPSWLSTRQDVKQQKCIIKEIEW